MEKELRAKERKDLAQIEVKLETEKSQKVVTHQISPTTQYLSYMLSIALTR